MEACNLLQGPKGIVGSRDWKRHRGRVTVTAAGQDRNENEATISKAHQPDGHRIPPMGTSS